MNYILKKYLDITLKKRQPKLMFFNKLCKINYLVLISCCISSLKNVTNVDSTTANALVSNNITPIARIAGFAAITNDSNDAIEITIEETKLL